MPAELVAVMRPVASSELSDEVSEILPMKVRILLSTQDEGSTMLVSGTQMSMRCSVCTLKKQAVSAAGICPAPSTWAMMSGRACTVASSPTATSFRPSSMMSLIERLKRNT